MRVLGLQFLISIVDSFCTSVKLVSYYHTLFVFLYLFSAVDLLYKFGGKELEPYYCLIEGGKDGWLFNEMQDLFYYMQILDQGENTILPRVISDYIPISDLPDLMRACGYYLTEFEVAIYIYTL